MSNVKPAKLSSFFYSWPIPNLSRTELPKPPYPSESVKLFTPLPYNYKLRKLRAPTRRKGGDISEKRKEEGVRTANGTHPLLPLTFTTSTSHHHPLEPPPPAVPHSNPFQDSSAFPSYSESDSLTVHHLLCAILSFGLPI